MVHFQEVQRGLLEVEAHLDPVAKDTPGMNTEKIKMQMKQLFVIFVIENKFIFNDLNRKCMYKFEYMCV